MTYTRGGCALALALIAGGACGPAAEDTPAVAAYAPAIDPTHFVATVDNEFYPLVPGTTFIYEKAGDAERVEVVVTDERRQIMGVPCLVVRSREYEAGSLVEVTEDWYAQDTDGNVWYFGEATQTYANGQPTGTAGSWEAGVDGAMPGIIMQRAPRVGDRYRQEYYVGHAEDMGEVMRLDDSVTVPWGTFGHVLVTRDWTPLEPGLEEQKYYAPGVGLLLEAEGDARVELVRVTSPSGPERPA